MKFKNVDLTGPVLSWAVATSEGEQATIIRGECVTTFANFSRNYASDWALCGPIIDRNWKGICAAGIKLMMAGEDKRTDEALLAFWMRCHVLHKLGDEVEVPDELVRDLPPLRPDLPSKPERPRQA